MATISEAIAMADAHQQAGNLPYAEQICRAVLQAEPNEHRALHMMGIVGLRRGDYQGAQPWLERAVAANPNEAAYLSNLGLALSGQGKLEEATAYYRRALLVNPDYPEANNNLGVVLRDLGQPEEAAKYYEHALTVRPTYADAHNNLAIVLYDMGRFEQAESHFRKAISLKPGVAEMYNNLGATVRELGRSEEALACYRQALSLKPHNPSTMNNLGILQQQDLHLEAAGAFYRQALAMDPNFVSAYENMSGALGELGRYDEARDLLTKALTLEPHPRIRYKRTLLLPVILESAEHLRSVRARLEAEVDSMVADQVRVDPLKLHLHANFYLAYQGLNERPLLEKLAQLCSEGCQDFTGGRTPGLRPGGRIHIGFLSTLFRNHTIGWYWKDNIAQLSRDRFEVTAISLKPSDDDVGREIRARADHFFLVPQNLVEARRRIAELGLDVLYYTDVGMDASTYALAASRLAPVQCVTWGHPLTTGLKTLDYFISSELLETEDAQDHYTEKLVRLRSLGLYLSRPAVPRNTKGRAELGLPEGKRLYACLQSTFKLHPDDDLLFAEILRRDPEGQIVLLRGMYPQWDEVLRKRFAAAIPDVADRICFVPRTSSEEFLRIYQLVDVLLDPLHFCGGKTSYEAFAMGVPVVTKPSRFLRGRITYALYRVLGVMDAVAESQEQYVELAVRMAQEPAFRADVGRRILAASDRLFNDRQALGELEEFLVQTVREKIAASGG
jgi:predicted O-linked N-acetylglucosamine transferase (SPINDLY family)